MGVMVGDFWSDLSRGVTDVHRDLIGWVSGSTKHQEELKTQAEIMQSAYAKQTAISQARSQLITRVVTVVGALGAVGLAGYIWIRARRRSKGQ